MEIKFGPAGLGPVKEAMKNLELFHQLGLTTCEIAFTYGVYIKNESDAAKIGQRAKELGISLRIHAPYWINLNSNEKEKIEKSKERILQCCKVGEWLGAEIVVFHPGFYGKKTKEESYQNILKAILEIETERKEKNYKTKIAPETMGKVNVFGSVEEIARLVSDSGCQACIDFAHILACDKDYRFEETLSKFKQLDKLFLHFSGIEYGEKGEKRHKKTEKEEWKKLLGNLKKFSPSKATISVVNESPQMVEDSIEGMKIFKESFSD